MRNDMRTLTFCTLAIVGLAFCGCSGSGSNSASAPPVDSGPKVVYSGGGVAELKRLEGKRLREIEIWEAADMKARLGKLLGDGFEAFKAEWMIESPITLEGDTLMMAGCDWNNNCDQNQYVMFVDTAKDNINVFHFKDGKEKVFKEKGDVALPEKFTQELASIKAKCGVKAL